MSDKLSASDIKEWLKMKSNCDQIDPEVTKSYLTEDLDNPLLHDLVQNNHVARMVSEEKLQLIETLREELATFTESHLKIIEKLGLSLDTLPEPIKESLEALASTGTELGLLKMTPATLAIEVSLLDEELATLEYQLTLEDFQGTKLQSELTEALHTQELIENLPNLSCSSQAAQTVKEMDFFPKKIANYEQKLIKLKAQLSQSGYEPAFQHEVLVKYGEDVKKLHLECANLQQKLNSFANLPPDSSLALDEINSARAKLQDLEEQFAQKVENLLL